MKQWTAWMSTKFPIEIPAALGVKVICPESFSAVSARKGKGHELCRRAERLGYSADLCSYTRIGIAAAVSGELPAPDMLLCCDNICSNMLTWYRELARILNIPLFLLDIPYRSEEEVSPETIAYLKHQVEEIIAGISELTEIPFRQDEWERVCRNANRSAEAWQQVMDLAKAPLPPLNNFELSDLMPIMVTGRCEDTTPDRLIAMTKEIAARPSPWEKPPLRIFFEGTPCWPHLPLLKKSLDERGIFAAMDTVSPSLLFRYEDTEGMLRAYCGTINGTSLASGLRSRTEMIREYNCQGVLVHYNRSCRPWCGTLPALERRLREETGLPVVSFAGDQADPGTFSAGQFETRLDGLLEIMEEMHDER